MGASMDPRTNRQPSRRTILAAASAVLLAPLAARASNDFPTRTIQLVVPYGPGGSVDVVGRAVADGFGRSLGNAIVVNRPGAGTVIGASSVAGAPADGHTLLVATPGIWVGSVLYGKTPFQYFDAFTPVSLVGRGPMMLSVRPALPARTVEEFVAYAKAHPGELTYADVGTGTTSTLTTEYFLQTQGIRARPIPYGGSTPALTDLIAGNIDFFFDGFVSSLPHVQSGRLRGLAVTHGQRIEQLAAVPTFKELGMPQMELHVLYGLVAPAGTPPAVLEALAKAVETTVADDAVRAKLLGLGIFAQARGPAAFGDIVRADIARWRQVVKT